MLGLEIEALELVAEYERRGTGVTSTLVGERIWGGRNNARAGAALLRRLLNVNLVFRDNETDPPGWFLTYQGRIMVRDAAYDD